MMETWLQDFVESFPELKKYCISQDNPPVAFINSPTELWLELEDWFSLAIDKDDYAMQVRIMEFLRACMTGRYGDTSSPMQQAILCGFLWWLGKRKEYWHLLPRWFTKEEIERSQIENWFSLNEHEQIELQSVLANGSASQANWLD